jgi:hypothetical protein
MPQTFKKLGWKITRSSDGKSWYVYDRGGKGIGAFTGDKGQAMIAALEIETRAGRIAFRDGWNYVS